MKNYFYDLHCHTVKSEHASAKLGEIVRQAKKRGVDGIAITDHDEVYSGDLVIDGIEIIPGTEVSTLEGAHLLGFFISEKIKRKEKLEVALEEIKRQGGFSVLAHPLRNRERFDKKIRRYFSRLDGMESGNAMDAQKEREKTEEECEKLAILQTAGSDVHASGQVGMGVVMVSERITRENFKEVVSSGVVVVRKESNHFREINRKWRKVMRLFKVNNDFFMKNFYAKIILKNYFRLQDLRLKKIIFNYRNSTDERR